MAKTALGDKQVCPNCGAKFYDLGRRPAACPKCQTAFDPGDETVKLKRTRVRAPNYETEDEEEEEKAVKRPKDEDSGDEEEIEEAPEIDAEVVDEPPIITDDDEEEAEPEGEIPAGFNEDDGEVVDEAAVEDDGVPLLEDEAEFDEEELGVPEEGGEDGDR